MVIYLSMQSTLLIQKLKNNLFNRQPFLKFLKYSLVTKPNLIDCLKPGEGFEPP